MSKRHIAIVLGNREEATNDLYEIVIKDSHPDIDFTFTRTERVEEFIRLASDSQTGLAIFTPPGNLIPDPARRSATPQEEAVYIVKAIKARHAIPIICIAVQPDARGPVLAAGADFFLDLPPQIAAFTSAVAACLKL